MNGRQLATIALTLAAGTACNSTFAPPSLVAGVRLLAVRAEPPYLPVDGSKDVQLDAKVVGVPAATPMCHAWALCLFALTQNGTYACVDPQMQVDLGTAPTATATAAHLFQMFAGAAAYAKSHPGATQTDPTKGPSALPGGSSKVKILYGVGEASAWGGTCPATAAEFLAKGCPNRDQCIISTTSLIVDTDGKSVHANPVLQGVTIDGVTLPDGATATVTKGDVKMSPVWTQPDQATKPSSVVFSWFATAGEYDNDRSYDAAPADTWLSKDVNDALVHGWVVAHDSLGGVAWTSFHLDRSK